MSVHLLHHIHLIRGQKVMLDADLAVIYGISTKQLNQAVKRNQERFPADFMFQLSTEEWQALKEQIAAEAEMDQSTATDLKSQNVTSSDEATETEAEIAGALSSVKWGGRRYAPYAFTEHGAIMLAGVLRSQRAVQASIQVVRAFVYMRNMLLKQEELSHRLQHLEATVEGNFNVVFDAINELMTEREQPRRRIGFKPEEE